MSEHNFVFASAIVIALSFSISIFLVVQLALNVLLDAMGYIRIIYL